MGLFRYHRRPKPKTLKETRNRRRRGTEKPRVRMENRITKEMERKKPTAKIRPMLQLEERNQRTENDPGSLFREQMDAALYQNHPYGIPIVGWKSEIEGLTLQDALDFYEDWYGPDNAILVVAGDVSVDEVKRLAEIHYGPIPAKGIEPRVRPAEPPHRAARRIEMSDPRVRQPYVIRRYLAPSRRQAGDETAAALTMLMEVAGGGGVCGAASCGGVGG